MTASEAAAIIRTFRLDESMAPLETREMGKGIYSSGHTQIFVTAEGTTWPTSFDDPGVTASQLRRPKPQRTWSGKLSARQKRLTESYPKPAEHLAEIVSACGGNIAWLKASSRRQERFNEADGKIEENVRKIQPNPYPLMKMKIGKDGRKTFVPK